MEDVVVKQTNPSVKVDPKNIGKLICSAKVANKLRDFYALSLDLQNVAGGIAVRYFVPYLRPFVPAIQIFSKYTRLGLYDAGARLLVRDKENLEHFAKKPNKNEDNDVDLMQEMRNIYEEDTKSEKRR